MKDLLQHLDALAHRPGTWIGPKALRPPVEPAPVIGHLRKAVIADAQVRVALVVTEQDVVARPQRLDEVVLQQQRLGLRADGGGVDAHDARHHPGDARTGQVLAEVRTHPLAQVTRLADVHHLVMGVDHPVDPRQRRQGPEKKLQLLRALAQRCRAGRRCRRGRAGHGGIGLSAGGWRRGRGKVHRQRVA